MAAVGDGGGGDGGEGDAVAKAVTVTVAAKAMHKIINSNHPRLTPTCRGKSYVRGAGATRAVDSPAALFFYARPL